MSEVLASIDSLMEQYKSPRQPSQQFADPKSIDAKQADPIIVNTPPRVADTLDKKAARGFIAVGRKTDKIAKEVLGLWGAVFVASVLSSTATYAVTHHTKEAMAVQPIAYHLGTGVAEGNL